MKNPYNCALSNDRPIIEQTTLNGLENFKQLVKISSKCNKRPACFDGMIMSIQSILIIYADQKQLGYHYLLTNRLNQDVIENCFALFRQRGGYNSNPTVRTFRCTFRACAKINLIKPSEKSNCETDEDINLPLNDEDLDETCKSESMRNNEVSDNLDTSSSSSTTSSSDHLSSSFKRISQNITLKDCSNTYFAGYLIKKCVDKFKCKDCENVLSASGNLEDKKQLLILFKTYKSTNLSVGLRKPSDDLIEFVEKALNILYYLLNFSPQKPDLWKIFLKKVIRKLDLKLLYKHVNCRNHIEYIIKMLFFCKVFKECKWKSQSEKYKGNVKNRKLQILKNL